MSGFAHLVSVSGGKDSTATYLRAMERGLPFQAVFADTGNEHEATYDAVRRLPQLDYDWSLSRTGIRARVEWSKTSRGGLQYDAFLAASENFGTSCNEWGACE